MRLHRHRVSFLLVGKRGCPSGLPRFLLCLTRSIVCCMGNKTANKQKGKQMRSNNKMILRAKLMKQYTEEWVLDCTGMSVDAIKEEMQQAYVDDRESVGWDCVSVDLDHSEITTNLEIIENDN